MRGVGGGVVYQQKKTMGKGLIMSHWADFQSKLDGLVKHVAETREEKSKAAEVTKKAEAKATADAAKKAEEQAKEARKAEDEAKRKQEEEAKAAKAADDKKKRELAAAVPAASTAPIVENSTSTNARDSPERARTRSPHPKSGSASSASKPELPKHIADAMAKRPCDRSDEETLLAAKHAKASRKEETSRAETWADATDAEKIDDDQ